MVSDEEGDKMRTFEKARQQKIKELLNGAVVADVFFDEGYGISAKTISGLTLIKGDEVFNVSIETGQFYEVTETRLSISGKMAEVENMITMPTPCDNCTKPNCKDRTTPGKWVIDCKQEKLS